MRMLVKWCVGVLLAALAQRAEAAIVARDSASDAAYADNWQGVDGSIEVEEGSDNGGFGFLPWSFAGGYFNPDASPFAQPHFIDNGPLAGNSLGSPAFALTNGNVAYDGYTAVATRSFVNPLQPDDVFSIDIDNPELQPLEPFDATGFAVELRDNAGTIRFAMYTYIDFNFNQWTITDELGDTPLVFGDETGSLGFNLALEYQADDFYNLTITPYGQAEPISVSGGLANFGTGGPIENVHIYIYGNGSDPAGTREFFFSNLQIANDNASQQGDTDGDLDVDITDLNNVRNNFASPNPPIGDTDGDLDVDIEDLNAVRNNFGVGTGQNAVPEPSAWCLAVAGLAATLARKSVKSRRRQA